MLMVYCSTISIIFSLFMFSMPLLSTDSTYYGIHDHQALPISAYPSTIEIALAYMNFEHDPISDRAPVLYVRRTVHIRRSTIDVPAGLTRIIRTVASSALIANLGTILSKISFSSHNFTSRQLEKPYHSTSS
jgi:hypothetical protein